MVPSAGAPQTDSLYAALPAQDNVDFHQDNDSDL